MQLISSPFAQSDSFRPIVRLVVDRQTLARRRWRGTAENGAEFGFELAAPLAHGTFFFQDDDARYLIEQRPEPVVVIGLDLPPSAAAAIGWAIGNLHMDLSAEPSRLLAPDDTAVRQLLDRLRIRYEPALAIFQPGRFSRGADTSAEVGPSHRH